MLDRIPRTVFHTHLRLAKPSGDFADTVGRLAPLCVDVTCAQ
jgi:hypothetical protein